MPKVPLPDIADMKVSDYKAIKRGAVVYRKNKASLILNSPKRVIVINLDPHLLVALMLSLLIWAVWLSILNPYGAILGMLLWITFGILKRLWRKYRA